jgi:superfamily II DNA or RNA helicase
MTFELRGYQQECVDKTCAGFGVYDRQLIVLGTGGGKTEIFIEVARRFRKKNPDKAVLILSHLSILTFQTLDRIKLRCDSLRTGVMQANIRPYQLSDVVIGTMQSSRLKDKADFLRNRLSKPIGLIIIDEAHYVPTPSYQKILSYYPDVKVLGVTATPFRSNKLMSNWFENVPYIKTAHELINQGYLVPPKIYQILRESDDLDQVIGQVVSIYKSHCDGKRAIIFMRTKNDCRTLREVFELYGVKSEVICDDTGRGTRDNIVESFTRGDTRVLISVDVLTAGFDSPAVEAIFLPYGTRSTTTYIQRLGRGLRRCDEIGKEFCQVFAFGDAPTLDSRYFEKASNLALNMGDEVREYPTVLETYDMNEMEELSEWNEKKIYTIEVAQAIRTLERSGYSLLAGSLNRRELPRAITMNIAERLKDLAGFTAAPHSQNKPPSKAQLSYLESLLGFEPRDLNQANASLLIELIVGPKKTGPYIVEDGRFKGRHISKLPYPYQSYILKKYPESKVATQIKQWRGRN